MLNEISTQAADVLHDNGSEVGYGGQHRAFWILMQHAF